MTIEEAREQLPSQGEAVRDRSEARETILKGEKAMTYSERAREAWSSGEGCKVLKGIFKGKEAVAILGPVRAETGSYWSFSIWTRDRDRYGGMKFEEGRDWVNPDDGSLFALIENSRQIKATITVPIYVARKIGWI